MLINKNGETFNIDQLSDGEKNLITLVGDIARRLAIANPNSSMPLKGEGIVLIDEIDLHLHPSWQRLIISQLTKVFPNCQFLITTHSPQVISQVKSESLFLLKNKNNELSYSMALESYGLNTDRILEDLLDVDARPSKEKKELHKIFQLIQDNKIEEAKSEIITLKNLIGEDPELVKASVLIKRKEILGK
jgi:predicted ATP-binding protein involved in virulence